MTDSERLDFVERISKKYTQALWQAKTDRNIGFVVTEQGDVLSGNLKDYPYRTLRAAIDGRAEQDDL